MLGESATAKMDTAWLVRALVWINRRKLRLLLLAFPVLVVAALGIWQTYRIPALSAFNACKDALKALSDATDDTDLQATAFSLCDRALQLRGLRQRERAIALYGRGYVHELRDEPDLAIAEYDAVIALIPDNSEVYFRRALMHNARGEIDQALVDYDTGIRLNPEESAAFVNRGMIRYDRREYDLALADFNRAIAIKPDSATAYNDRGLVIEAKGDLDGALADYDKAIALKSDYGKAYNNRGGIYNRKEKPDLALPDLVMAVQLMPGNSAPLYNRGTAYRMLGDYDRAIGDYNQVLKITPDMAAALYGRGISYYGLNHRSDQGLADLMRSVELDPDLQNAQNDLCYLLATAGRAAEALPHCDRAVALDPGSLMALANRAYAYLWLKDWLRAIDGFTDYLKRNPDAADIRFMRGYAHERAGETQAATDDYAAARAAAPGIDDDMRGRYGIVAGSADIRMQL